jgi:hypothetical protein
VPRCIAHVVRIQVELERSGGAQPGLVDERAVIETVPGKRSMTWCPRPQSAIVTAPVQMTNRGEYDNAVPATYTNR